MTVKGPAIPVGSTTGMPPMDSFEEFGAPMTIVERPDNETDAVAPAANVCASTVVPLADVTLIQQSDVVAPIVSE